MTLLCVELKWMLYKFIIKLCNNGKCLVLLLLWWFILTWDMAKENEISWLVLIHVVQLLQYPVPAWAATPTPVGLPRERPLLTFVVNITVESVLVSETLCQLGGRRTLPVHVGNPKPGGCWDGDTAWRMPRRQWCHHNWGCCCIDIEAGWYRRSPPGAPEQTLIPQNEWTDSHRMAILVFYPRITLVAPSPGE